jgi:hypothetical protein
MPEPTVGGKQKPRQIWHSKVWHSIERTSFGHYLIFRKAEWP